MVTLISHIGGRVKIIKASDYIGAAKHYLENEIEAPDIDTMPSPDIEDNDPSGVS